MYEKFFSLRERPFELTPNPRFVVLTDGHREALSTLHYGIATHKGITLLVGEAGSGKTTMIRAAVERQSERVTCVHVENPALTRDEFIELLAARLGLSETAGRSKAAFLLELESLLARRRREGETTVLIVDEAQSLPLELLEEVRLLANIETTEEKLLSVILAGQPELALRLEDSELRQLKQRIALRCELRVLTLTETAAYLAGRIRAAGGAGAQVLTRDAVTAIFEHSRGIPRTINVLADNALLTAFAAGERPVRRDTVLEVCRDFRIGSPTLSEDTATADSRVEAPSAAAPPRSTDAVLVFETAPGTEVAMTSAADGIPQESAPKRSRFPFFGRN